MSWFQKLERKYSRYAIKNLTLYLIICYAIGYVLQFASMYNSGVNILVGYLTLDVYAILHGQVWRLVTWLLIPPGAFDIFTLVMLYCYFSIGTVLDRTWGEFRYNVFMFMGILFTIVGAILLYLLMAAMGNASGLIMEYGNGYLQLISMQTGRLFSTYYISMSIFLAFAITFPDSEMMFMFVIPIKAKVLGIFYVLMMAYIIFTSFAGGFINGVTTATVIIFSLLNVLVFWLITRRKFISVKKNKRKFDFDKPTAVRPKSASRHKCAICGRTELSDADEDFRYCTKCEGNYEYCSKHIYTHTHVKKQTN